MLKNFVFILYIFLSMNKVTFSMNEPLQGTDALIEAINDLTDQLKIITALIPSLQHLMQGLSQSIIELSQMGTSYHSSVNEALVHIRDFIEIANTTVKYDIPKIISLGEEYQQIGWDVANSIKEAVVIANQTILEIIPELQHKYDPLIEQISTLADTISIGFCILVGAIALFAILYSGHKIVRTGHCCWNNYCQPQEDAKEFSRTISLCSFSS